MRTEIRLTVFSLLRSHVHAYMYMYMYMYIIYVHVYTLSCSMKYCQSEPSIWSRMQIREVVAVTYSIHVHVHVHVCMFYAILEFTQSQDCVTQSRDPEIACHIENA